MSAGKGLTAELAARKVALKERARQQRKEAYRKAKEARSKDPVHLALKQKAKEQRREAYRAAKERHQARVAEEKARQSVIEQDEKVQRRAAMDAALMTLLRRERSAP